MNLWKDINSEHFLILLIIHQLHPYKLVIDVLKCTFTSVFMVIGFIGAGLFSGRLFYWNKPSDCTSSSPEPILEPKPIFFAISIYISEGEHPL